MLRKGRTETATKTLFVGNLPWSAGPEDLERMFSPHAEVLAARIATDRETGRSRGFGFVEVPEEQAQTAIDAVNGVQMDGRPLTVNEARPREERPRRY
jgi:RNA recognition motif-containing protein